MTTTTEEKPNERNVPRSASLIFSFLLSLILTTTGLSGCAVKVPYLKQPVFQAWPGMTKNVGLGLDNLGMATVPKEGLIVVEGDEPAYGADPFGGGAGINGSSAPRTNTPFPEMLQKYLGVRVENRGFPGDTIAEGHKRWADRPLGNLLVIAYGYNDAKAKTSNTNFTASLSSLIEQGQAQGAAIILIIPPAYADANLSVDAEPLRIAMRKAQVTYRTNIVDLQKAITAVAATEPNILSDPDLSHPKKVVKSHVPTLLNPLVGRDAKARESARQSSALYTRIADMLAIDVAVPR